MSIKEFLNLSAGNRTNTAIYICVAFLVLLAICPFIFSHPIYIWDESIYVNNSLEMVISKNFFSYQVDGQTNYYNVKPPLALWSQAISMMIFGINDWSPRIPSFLAYLGIVFIIFRFAQQHISLFAAIVSVLVFISVKGFLRPHVGLSADLDALLVFFIAAYTFYFLDCILKDNAIHQKDYLILWVLLSLAILTKSTAALLPLPGLALVLIWNNSLLRFMKSKYFWLYGIAGISMIILWYFIQYFISPEYVKLVWNTEIKRFTHNIMSWHNQPYYYYLQNIYIRFFDPYFFPLLLSPLGLLIADPKIKRVYLMVATVALAYLIIISYPIVKLEWYDAPLYPFFAVIVGLFVDTVVKYYTINHPKNLGLGIQILIIVLMIFGPFRFLFKHNEELLQVTDPLEQDGLALRELKRQDKLPPSTKVILPTSHLEHTFAALFYVRGFNYKYDYDLSILPKIAEIKSGDYVLSSSEPSIDSLRVKFKLTEKYKVHSSTLYLVEPRMD